MKENITENQIIEFLKQKRLKLLDDLHKTETALSALGIEHDESSSLAYRPAIDSRKKTNPPPLGKIENYKSDLKLDEKIAFALTHLKYGTKKEITEYLTQVDTNIDSQKLENNIAVRLSSLLKANQIDGNRKGRTYSYHLIR